MALDHAAYLDAMRNVYGASRAEQVMRDRIGRLDGIVQALASNPLAPAIRIFGSAAASPSRIPGDIDAFVDMRLAPASKPLRLEGLHGLLRLAVLDGYHGNYGMFDPFVLSSKGRLFCRNEGAAMHSVDWQRAAQHADEIVAAGRAGVPLACFTRSFTQQFASGPEPVPEAGGTRGPSG